MALNLWSWVTADHQQHVGVSVGPQMDSVLDLSLISPALRSVHALWEQWPEPQTLERELHQALSAETRRLSLEGVALQVPVAMSEC